MRLYGTVLVLMLTASTSVEAGWKAGVARTVITPRQNMWMSGYGGRDHAATGKLTELWAKALVIEDGSGHRGVIVSLDLVGIDRQASLAIRNKIAKDHGLTLADVALCTSHTHSGPVVGSNLKAMYAIDDAQWQLVDDYIARMQQDVIRIVGEAFGNLQPAELAWGVGQCTLAVNRRENREADVPTLREQGALKGPVDHEAPVLRVSVGGDVRAVLFGYACHATTLSGYEWCGDWPGYAQMAIEESNPGVTALFFAGCGADQNPLPRRTIELAKGYGAQMAAAVDDVINGDMQPVKASLQTTYHEIDLALAHIPSRADLQQTLKSENRYEVGRAKFLLAQLSDESDATLPATYPYPIQMWRLGDVTGVFLGGEVVVDYSLAIKGLDPKIDFVAGYANDVMSYIPSERVLMEGGYEGARSMIYYGLPSPWATGLEKQIMDTVQAGLQSLAP